MGIVLLMQLFGWYVYMTNRYKVPVVHLAPLHPTWHAQVFGRVQLPPFGQDVCPKHKAETNSAMSTARYIGP